MKEVLGSLPEVITAYKNYNLLVPTATDVQLNPFYKFHVEEVPVDLGENSGDIFKVGSVKTGKQDERGKDIWEDVFSLSKPLLNKMAMAAGIQFNPKETYGERIDRVTYRAQAQGAMRKADGTARTETDQKVICLEDEEEKYRIEFADKAAKGITDEKQAQAAAEIFSGQWVESKNKWGKKCQAFVVAKEDRDRYIDRSVMVNMALLKKTWAEKAMTGAKLRVIRALLGVKGTYTKAELQKNFAIPTVIFSPDFSDPQVRQAMLTQGMNSVNNMFGTPQIAVKSVDFESESTVFKVLKALDRNRGQFICCFTKQAQPDFKGILMDSTMILFDAKHTDKDKISRDVVTAEQQACFERYMKLGAMCFLVVSLEFKEFYRVPWVVFRDMKKIYGHKYMNREELEP